MEDLPNFSSMLHVNNKRKDRSDQLRKYFQLYSEAEKIHTPRKDGILQILAGGGGGGGGVKGSGNPGGRGVELQKVFRRGHLNR